MDEKIVTTSDLLKEMADTHGFDERFSSTMYDFIRTEFSLHFAGESPTFMLGSFGKMVASKPATEKLLAHYKKQIKTLGGGAFRKESWIETIQGKIDVLQKRLDSIEERLAIKRTQKGHRMTGHERKPLTTIVKNF